MSRLPLAAAAVVVVCLLSARCGPPSEPTRLVVLPFQNLDDDPATDWRPAGLTRDLADRLARLDPDRLVVVGREHPGPDTTPPVQRARQIDADWILAGDVKQGEQRIRIGLRLLRVADGTTHWRALRNAMPREVLPEMLPVLMEAATALGLDEAAAFDPTQDHALDFSALGYDRYLQGLARDDGTTDGRLKALGQHRLAITRSRALPDAWAAIATTCCRLAEPGVHDGDPALWLDEARDAARRALAFEPGLPHALGAMALATFVLEGDAEAARADLARAVAADPGSAWLRRTRARLAAAEGRLDEALAAFDAAARCEPLDPGLATERGWTLWSVGRVEEAAERFASAPDGDASAAWGRGLCALAGGRADEAVDVLRAAHAARGAHPALTGDLAWALASAGRADEARAMLDALEERRRELPVPASALVAAAAALGDLDAARRHHERAVAERDWITVLRPLSPRFAPLGAQDG